MLGIVPLAWKRLRLGVVNRDGIGRRQHHVLGRIGDADHAIADAAELHGLPAARGRDELDGDGLGGGRGLGVEAEQLFDAYFQDSRELKSEGRVGDVIARFDGVDGLARGSGELG